MFKVILVLIVVLFAPSVIHWEPKKTLLSNIGNSCQRCSWFLSRILYAAFVSCGATYFSVVLNYTKLDAEWMLIPNVLIYCIVSIFSLACIYALVVIFTASNDNIQEWHSKRPMTEGGTRHRRNMEEWERERDRERHAESQEENRRTSEANSADAWYNQQNDPSQIDGFG